MKIEQLTPGDSTHWRRLWLLYLSESKRSLSEEIGTATWNRMLDDASPIFGLAAWDGDTMVGIAHYLLHPTTWSLQPRCYLNDLFTHGGVRGRGFGKAMINAVYERAAVLGCDRVYWLTHENNLAARALYDQMADRSGFVEYRLKLA